MGNIRSSCKSKVGSESGFQLTRPPSYIITEDILKEAGEISPERLDELRYAFKAFDKDNSHAIDASELRYVLESMGQCPTDRDMDMMVTMADVDHNGVIDFEEFVLMMLWYEKNHSPEEELRQAFKVFDKDCNGFIDREDFKRLMMTRGECISAEEAEEMAEDADLNKIGKIHYEEFITLLCAPFSTMIEEPQEQRERSDDSMSLDIGDRGYSNASVTQEREHSDDSLLLAIEDLVHSDASVPHEREYSDESLALAIEDRVHSDASVP